MANHPENQPAPQPELSAGSKASAKVHKAIDHTAQGANAIVDRVGEKVAPAVDNLRSGVGSTAAALHRGVEEIDEYQERWLGRCRGRVRDYPLASLGVALTAGILVSRLLRR